MTPFRSLLTTLLLSFFITTTVTASGVWSNNIVFSPSDISTNEAFDVTASGWFGYANTITAYTVSVASNNITIDLFAPFFEIGLTVMTPWQVTAHIPPLGAGNYLVRVVMHGNNEPTHIEESVRIRIPTTNINDTVLWRPRIASIKVGSSQTTNQTSAVNLTFAGNTTSEYIVQSSTDLLTWTNEVVSLQSTNSTRSTSLPLIDRKRFYRIIEYTSP